VYKAARAEVVTQGKTRPPRCPSDSGGAAPARDCFTCAKAATADTATARRLVDGKSGPCPSERRDASTSEVPKGAWITAIANETTELNYRRGAA
jgi:hypothetical protein